MSKWKLGKIKVVNQCPSLDTIKSGRDEDEEECQEELSSDELDYRKRSDQTLNSVFFDNLWPLILDENPCQIKSKKGKYFEPFRRFDRIWAHSLLADKQFKDYPQPTLLRCVKPVKTEPKVTRTEEKCRKVLRPKIPTLTEQIDEIERDKQWGQKLSYAFIMRQRPWYMKMSIFDDDFVITDDMVAQFKEPFVLNIAKAVQKYKCKLMIIDMGVEISIDEMEKWMAFCKFINILVVARDPIKGRQLRAMGDIFYVMDLDECLESTWQEELESAVNESYRCAVECNLLETIASEFIFVFSQNRGLCKFDTFEVLSKSI